MFKNRMSQVEDTKNKKVKVQEGDKRAQEELITKGNRQVQNPESSSKLEHSVPVQFSCLTSDIKML